MGDCYVPLSNSAPKPKPTPLRADGDWWGDADWWGDCGKGRGRGREGGGRGRGLGPTGTRRTEGALLLLTEAPLVRYVGCGGLRLRPVHGMESSEGKRVRVSWWIRDQGYQMDRV